MGAAERAGEQPRRASARLQSDKHQQSQVGDLQPVDLRLLSELERVASNEQGTSPEQSRRAAENLARRASDRALLTRLAEGDFTGPEYEAFAGELAAYGYPVLVAWIRRGLIFKHCAERGRRLFPTDQDLQQLFDSYDDRLELALETVGETVPFFRDYVLKPRRWTFEGGATLTTYFVGACVYRFPNVFRRWHGERHRWSRNLQCAELEATDSRPLTNPTGVDPADAAAGKDRVMRELVKMTDGARDAAALVIDGASQAEAASILGTTERAIEGRLHRYRNKVEPPPNCEDGGRPR